MYRNARSQVRVDGTFSDDLVTQVGLDQGSALRDYSFSKYAKFSEKLSFFTPWYAQYCVRTKWMTPKSLAIYYEAGSMVYGN